MSRIPEEERRRRLALRVAQRALDRRAETNLDDSRRRALQGPTTPYPRGPTITGPRRRLG